MNAKDLGRTALHAIPAVTMAVSGTGKLTGLIPAEQFEAWGYPRWFSYVSGATEVASAALLARPRTSLIGGGLAAGVLAGAFSTHLMHREYARLPFPVVVGLATALSVWTWRARALPLHEPARGGLPSDAAERRAIEGVPTGEL